MAFPSELNDIIFPLLPQVEPGHEEIRVLPQEQRLYNMGSPGARAQGQSTGYQSESEVLHWGVKMVLWSRPGQRSGARVGRNEVLRSSVEQGRNMAGRSHITKLPTLLPGQGPRANGRVFIALPSRACACHWLPWVTWFSRANCTERPRLG